MRVNLLIGIRPSEDAFQPISSDTAICPDCERELFDPHNRRYLHPFINCIHCGPRFTTMADFPLCDDCRAEYENPTDRRFHTQPMACSKCGSFVTLRETHTHTPSLNSNISTIEYRLSAILKTRRLLREGMIVAVKGLGGFHLACDAGNPIAVEQLHHRRGSVEKPFALMAADLETIKNICGVNEDEVNLLTSREKPTLLLEKKRGTNYSIIAPNMDTLGIMLPCIPLYHLLLNQTDPVLARESAPALLVMTNGNLGEEPIAIENEEALERLSPLVDAFLLHDLPIHVH